MKTVLIVDDAPTVLKIVCFTLQEEGFRVVQATSADEALERLEGNVPDIGIFDINMPGRNGIELTRAVKNHPNGRDMKIVMLTTESSEEIKEAGREAGAIGWLIKPFRDEDLIGLLNRL